MPVEFRPLERSFVSRDGLYDEESGGRRTIGHDEEDQFRRELEMVLFSLIEAIDGAITRLSTEASLASTRDGFTIMPVGRTTWV